MKVATPKSLLDHHKISDRLQDRPFWKMLTAVPAIERRFIFQDFRAAFSFMTKVASEAEILNHHPEWCNSGNRVNVALTTHSAGGITDLDFALADAIDDIAADFELLDSLDSRCGCSQA